MKFEKINLLNYKKRILIAPLDWGLGHATRCIPIIYTLLELDYEVIIAADGPIKNLLQLEFPNVVFTKLKGYKIHYTSNKFWLPFRLALQFPKLLWCIYQEHLWVKRIVATYNIDAVLSDNRMGLSHSKIPCIYITHQLKIKTGNIISEWLAQKIHYFFINKYSFCWVPDSELANNLAGDLSHPDKMPAIPVKYIGPLSRFEKITTQIKYDLLILISGPEPQRTIFETLLLKELKTFTGSVAFVKGLPVNVEKEQLSNETTKNISVANHLHSNELNKIIQQSEMIICRSGYTTVMDLIKLGKKAILVPTPGQTEQEYLAGCLMEKGVFFSVSQKDFSLNDVLQKSACFSFVDLTVKQNEYKKIISEFTRQLL